jgi:hypothetical protein
MHDIHRSPHATLEYLTHAFLGPWPSTLASVRPCDVVKHVAPTLDQSIDHASKLKQNKNYENLHEHFKYSGQKMLL